MIMITTMPTSILHSLSTFLSRRYNLNSTPSDRDCESLARNVAYSLKHIPPTTTTSPASPQSPQQLDMNTSIEDGNDELETTLVELEEALTSCESSLDQFETKERFLYVRIERYREMIRERECFLVAGIQEHDEGEQEHEIRRSSDDEHDANSSVTIEKEGEGDEAEVVDAQVPDNDVENNDIKNNNNLTKEQITQLRIKHQQDQTNLKDVETIHADIIVQIETLKRRILELADKKEDILRKREECHEFLVEFAEREL